MQGSDLTNEARDIDDSPPTGSGSGGLRSFAGVVAVAVSLGISEFLAGILTALPSLVTGVATFVIDNVPAPIKEWAIETFGTADKLVLGIGIVVVSLGFGAIVGRVSGSVQAMVFGAFGLLAALAAARSPQVGLFAALVAGAIAALAGYFVLAWLRPATPVVHSEDRRRLLAGAGALGVLAVGGGALGMILGERGRRVLSGRADVVLPAAVEPVRSLPAAASLDVSGITPIVVANEDFYRIDTAPFAVPQVDIATWRMKVTGMVDRELVIDFEDLLDMPMVERYVTLSCVSNEVGGGLVGNALWLGVPLSEVLDRAGIQPGAEQIVGRSVDGFTVGFPAEVPFDGRDALIAVGMNGEPLPPEHGYPARLVVAGLYGYVSATKWLSEIELTTWDGFDAYWIPRGWSKLGPVKTQSRIDTPRPSANVTAGPHAIAGVAWAPSRGIERVEVSIDDGAFEEAELSDPLSDSAWVQWRFPWEATPGRHTARVRATDGDGITQTENVAKPAPSGATGYHTVTFEVV